MGVQFDLQASFLEDTDVGFVLGSEQLKIR